jgi:predicted flap endonuclease-1-like 5' DNA nuclease
MPTPEPPIDTSGDPAPSRTPWAVHVACYVLLALLLAWILVQRYLRPLVLEEGITVAASRPASADAAASSQPASPLDQRIDPNTATWSELTRLPRIGEQIAKRIVEYRETHRAAAGSGSGTTTSPPVFACPQDLGKVRGIGPKTVEQITPHLKFSAPPTTRPH